MENLLYYGILTLASLFFSVQFAFSRQYQQDCGTSLPATFQHTTGYNLIGFLILFCINGFRLHATPFTVIFGILTGLDAVGYLFCSLRALSKINLTLYAVFSSLGNLLLPALVGIVFFKEQITPGKIICCVLIVIALALTVRKPEKSAKAGKKSSGRIYYVGVFVLSGMSGVLSKFHNSLPFERADAASFAMWNALSAMLISAVALFIVSRRAKIPRLTLKAVGSIAAYGALNKTGIYLLLIALVHLPAAAQYPFVTGGNMIFPTVIAFFTKDKPQKREILSVILAFVGVLFLVMW